MHDLVSMPVAALLGHAIASLTQNLLHRWLGHSAAGGALQRLHLSLHHAIYTEARMLSARFRSAETSLTPLYLVPAGVVAALGFWLLPVLQALCLVSGVAASFAAHVYLHEQFHLSGSKLQRYRWFRRRRLLHAVHHRDGSRNFGLVDFYWDRLFGTFRDVQVVRPS